MSRKRILSVLVAAVVTFAACDDPVQPPPPLSDQMLLFAFLTPESARHAILISAVDHYSRPDLSGVKVKIYKQSQRASPEWSLVAEWDSAHAAAAGLPLVVDGECRWETGQTIGFRDAYCMRPALALEAGATYRIEAMADGRSTARAETTIPGDFEIERAVLSADAGAHSLSAEWTPSVAAYRYLAGIRYQDICVNCFRGWTADVETTSFSGKLPQDAVDNMEQQPRLDVVAVDQHYHAYVTTGHRGIYHEVHPVQNVRGGYGVVGSYRFRSHAIVRK